MSVSNTGLVKTTIFDGPSLTLCGTVVNKRSLPEAPVELVARVGELCPDIDAILFGSFTTGSAMSVLNQIS